MNKLIFSEGGQPIHLDDLEFLQSSVASPVQAIATAFGDCVLTGCYVQWNNQQSLSVSSGYIAYKGQVYAVADAELTQGVSAGNDAPLRWLFETVEVESKIFEDGSEQPTRKLYTARVVQSATEPSSASVEVRLLPALGVDFARRPHLTHTYDGVGRLVEFAELSRYSGVLTLELSGVLPLSGAFGQFTLMGVNNMLGRVEGNHPSLSGITIELTNGKLSARSARADGSSISDLRLTSNVYITLFVSWDYELNNGAGSGVNQNGTSGNTNYTGGARRGSMSGRA